MTDDEIQYQAFKTIWKVLGQTRPGIMYEERFLIAITATSDDRFERVKQRNWRKIDKLRQK